MSLELVVGSITIVAVLSMVFWTLTGTSVYPLVATQPALHLATIFLSVASYILLDLFTLVAVLRILDRAGMSLLFGFLMGVQMVAGLSAYLFVRRARRQR